MSQLRKSLCLLTLISIAPLMGCGQEAQTDGPVSEVEQEELQDQLNEIQQQEMKKN